MAKSKGKVGDSAMVNVTTSRSHRSAVGAKGIVRAEAYGPTGNLKWQEGPLENLVVVEGLNHARDLVWLNSTSQQTAWYLGLTATDPTFASGDTHASHAGWTEVTTYSEGTREVWTGATTAAGQADNSATQAAFSINGTDGFGGVFMANNNTKGSTSGGSILHSGVAFSQNRSLASGDTLKVTYTLSYSDAT